MTNEEFGQWYDHHCTLFPDIAGWLKRTDPNGILVQWANLLDRVAFLDAKAASRSLYESETRPRTYADHPKWIAAECKRQAQKKDEVQAFARFGQLTYKCLTCRDTGLAKIYVVGDLLYRGLRMHGPDKVLTHTACIHCDCTFGRSLGYHGLDRSWMIVSLGSSLTCLEANPEAYERRWKQVYAMMDEMEMMA